jgi:excisionase family DNA binding protein
MFPSCRLLSPSLCRNRAAEAEVENKTAQPRLLRVEEAADLLAVKPSTVRAWLLRRRIGKVRIGQRAVRIPAGEVERIIAEGTIPAREPR